MRQPELRPDVGIAEIDDDGHVVAPFVSASDLLAHDVDALATADARQEHQPRRATTGSAGDDDRDEDTALDRRGLTPRQRQVLELMAAGQTNREIAAQLSIGERTAAVHASHVLSKLGVADRAQAALVAQRLGLIAA
jgi:DNA-binding NarL/FixJ family response regulator